MVHATDPIIRAGVFGELRDKPPIELLDDPAEADIVVAALETGLHTLPTSSARLVLVANQLRQADLWVAIQHGLTVLLPISEASADRLLQAVGDAYVGRASLPPEQLGQLLAALSDLHEQTLAPRDLTLSGLSPREIEVLRLMADGFITAEIAEVLTYSQRTVKNIVQGVLARLNLRSRPHAVAYAIRHGLI